MKSKQPLEPLPGYVVLKEYKLEEKIAGRLVMPPTAENAPSLGEVIAVGFETAQELAINLEHMKLAKELNLEVKEAAKNYGTIPTLLNVGDIVAYQNYGGQELKLDNVKYLLVPFDKLLAKVNVKE